MKSISVLAFAIALLSGCDTNSDRVTRFCEDDNILVDAQFEGGSFDSCTISSDGRVAVTIRPEDWPINISPWYAFRVSPKRPGIVHVIVSFNDGYARYWPKMSTDTRTWQRLDTNAVELSDDGKTLGITVPVVESPVWIAGQELLTASYYEEWIQELVMPDEVEVRLLGRSVQGRPIFMASTPAQKEAVFLLGRQHPPEVTGALAMRPFVETVLGDTEVARAFRNRYMVIVIPMINPDGVALGYWRHNVNGVDLNRDWGLFSQPETQSVGRLLDDFDRLGIEPKLMLDFHSTKSNLFYTQIPEDDTGPIEFAQLWLDRARERLPNFDFKYDPRPPSGQENTKNYFFKRYGIPAITYELSDQADREKIVRSSPVFAEEMMRVMLEYPKP